MVDGVPLVTPSPRLYHFSVRGRGSGLFVRFSVSIHRTVSPFRRQNKHASSLKHSLHCTVGPEGPTAIWALWPLGLLPPRLSESQPRLRLRPPPRPPPLRPPSQSRPPHILIDTNRHHYCIIIGRGKPFVVSASMINSKFRGWCLSNSTIEMRHCSVGHEIMTVKGLPPTNTLSRLIRQAIHPDQGYLQKAKLADCIGGEGYAQKPQLLMDTQPI
jgi:hypothetical protein